MEPARTIIERLGGEAKVADIAGVAKSTPYGWQKPKSQGGSGGLIPQRYHLALLDHAKGEGIPLSAEDFLPAREVA